MKNSGKGLKTLNKRNKKKIKKTNKQTHKHTNKQTHKQTNGFKGTVHTMSKLHSENVKEKFTAFTRSHDNINIFMLLSLENIWFWSDINRHIQVQIKGYEVVHTVVMEFEARKSTNVDLINFDTAIKIKIIKFEYTTEQFQKCMNTSTIFDNTISASIFAHLIIKKTDILIFYISWRL